MDANKEIGRIAFGFLMILLWITCSAAYWAITGRDSIALRDDNPRLVEREAQIRRGAIYDSAGTLLTETVQAQNNALLRISHHEAAYSAIGYFSLRYGSSSIEAAFDQFLRGDHLQLDFPRFFDSELLHRPRVGADLMLTISLPVQQSLARVFSQRKGAAIVIGVPDGNILGMISLPTYNPNTLDQDWETLIQAEGNPFFNRAMQGVYQPGGILQTPLMAASLLTEQPFDTITADASAPVLIDDLTIRCGLTPSARDLTLIQAYAYACPRPFALLSRQLNPQTLERLLLSFGLNQPAMIAGFSPEQQTEQNSVATILSEDLVADILGQGQLTVSPLNMAMLTSSIINQGNAPQPYLLAQMRNPAEDWTSIEQPVTSYAYMTSETARRLRELMAANMQQGVVRSADQEGLAMGAHAALAHSGEQSQTWFIGYVMKDGIQGAALAIVMEDTDDLAYGAYAGGLVLQTIYNQLQSSD
jgi:peptidoglycan glycosyltransferase